MCVHCPHGSVLNQPLGSLSEPALSQDSAQQRLSLALGLTGPSAGDSCWRDGAIPAVPLAAQGQVRAPPPFTTSGFMILHSHP